jgi:uncharacterized protein YjbI with pentapeptide repeats
MATINFDAGDREDALAELRARMREVSRAISELTIENIDLRRMDFSSANLDAVHLINCNLSGCNFSNAHFSGIYSFSNFNRANLSKAILSKSTFTKADFTRANLSRVLARKTVFWEAKLIAICADDGDFTRAHFGGANLRGSSFSGATFERTYFDHAQVFGATFSGARELDKAHLVGIDVGDEAPKLLSGEEALTFLRGGST